MLDREERSDEGCADKEKQAPQKETISERLLQEMWRMY